MTNQEFLWQEPLLDIISKFLDSVNQSDKLMGLKLVEKVVQIYGQSLREPGWSIIIQLIGSAANDGQNQQS